MRIRNKAMAVSMVIIFFISFMLPGFISPRTAQAACTYSALSVPIVQKNAPNTQNLGVIQVDLANCAIVRAGDVLTVALPSGVTMSASGPAAVTVGNAPAGANPTGVEVFIPNTVGTAANGLTSAAAGATAVVTGTKTSIDITFGATGSSAPGQMLIYINNANIGTIDGDIVAALLGPANSPFNMDQVIIAKVASSMAGTVTSIQSAKKITAAGGQTDIISICENAPSTVTAGDIIKVKLPIGFSWANGAGTQSWGWAGGAPVVSVDPVDNRILNVSMSGPNFPSLGSGGRVNFVGQINVDESVAPQGDIVARIYDTNGNITETDLVVAVYGQSNKGYEVLDLPVVHADSTANLGVIQVYIPNVAGKVYETVYGGTLTVNLPDTINLPGAAEGSSSEVLVTSGANAPAGGSGIVEVFAPQNTTAGPGNSLAAALNGATAAINADRNSININFNGFVASEPGEFYIYLRAASIGAISADVTANISSNRSDIFPAADLTVAKYTDASLPNTITYSALSTPTLVSNSGFTQNLGVIQIDISNCAAIKAGDVLTISLPSCISMAASGPATLTSAPAPSGPNDTGVEVFVPNNVGSAANGLSSAIAGASVFVAGTKNAMEITLGGSGSINAGQMIIFITNVSVGSVEGDIVATMLAPANSAFPSGSVIVGKTSGAASSTVATILSIKTIGSAGGAIDVVSVTETAPNTLKAGEVIKVKLPAGYTWGQGAGSQSWGWAGAVPTIFADAADPRILNVIVNDDGSPGGNGYPSAIGGLSGRVNFAALIRVDDAVAKTGDIIAHIYSKDGGVTETDLVVGKYATYGVSINEGNITNLIAGKYDQKIGNFYLDENIGGSLINGRQIKLTLPAGVKWSGSYSPASWTALPAPPTTESGSAMLGTYAITDNNTTLKTYVTSGTKSTFNFKNLKVDISPAFSGPLTLTIGGDAGVAGEVVVANVEPVLEISTENITKITAGTQDQELGTIILRETAAGNIALNVGAIDTWDSISMIPAISGAAINLTLPGGAEWSDDFPTIVVTEGDLQLKTDLISKNGCILTIPIKSSSTIPSTIKISGLKATLYNTVPNGSFNIEIDGPAINETGGLCVYAGQNYTFPQYSPRKVTVAGIGSGSANLTDLKVDGTTVKDFDAATLTYYVSLPADSTAIPAISAASEAGTAVNIVQASCLDGTEAERTAIITVTAQDAISSQTYQVIFALQDPSLPHDYLEKNLLAGWNILSIPLELEMGHSKLGELLSDPSKLVLAYRYDSSAANKWIEISANTVLNPMDAICIKVSADTSAKLYPSTNFTGGYTTTLNAGWNLFGPALDISSGDSKMIVSRVLYTLNSGKYSRVISPRMGTQNAWVYVPGDSLHPNMKATEGYWIYMKEAGTLEGSSYTPVTGIYYEPTLSQPLSSMMLTTYAAESIPAIPAAFQGTVKDQAGNPVPEGTIDVVIDGVVRATKSFVNGEFGLSYGERLIVEKMYYAYAEQISFTVNGYAATSASPIDWSKASGNLTELNLIVDTVLPVNLEFMTVALSSPNVVELSFSKELQQPADLAALKSKIKFSAEGTAFNPLGANDQISIAGKKLIITFESAIRGDNNQITIEADALSDLDGNLLAGSVQTPVFSAQVVDKCFIATAAFGSQFQPAVVLLRAFRDKYLLTNPLGISFVKFYYQNSPPIAAFIAHSEPLKALVRILLTPLVAIVYLLFNPVLGGMVLLGLAMMLIWLNRRKRIIAQV